MLRYLPILLLAACRPQPTTEEVVDRKARVRAIVTLERNVREGPARMLYANGTVAKEGEYRAGLKTGTWVEYDRQQQRRARSNYARGLPHDTCRWWSADGQLVKEERYEHGVLQGRSREWYPGGGMKQEVHYVDGKLQGTCKRWKQGADTLTAATLVLGQYLDNKVDGIWRGYYGDGTLHSEGRYEMGHAQGPWHLYDRSGRLVQVRVYVNGKVVRTTDLAP